MSIGLLLAVVSLAPALIEHEANVMGAYPAARETFSEGMAQRWQAFTEAGVALRGRIVAARPASPSLAWSFALPGKQTLAYIQMRLNLPSAGLSALMVCLLLMALWAVPRLRRAWLRHRTLQVLRQAAPYLERDGAGPPRSRWRRSAELDPAIVPGEILIEPAALPVAEAEALDLDATLRALRGLIITLKAAWSAGRPGAWRSALSDEMAWELTRQLSEQGARYQFETLNLLDIDCRSLERMGNELFLRLIVRGRWQRSAGGMSIGFHERWNWMAAAQESDAPQPWRLVAAVSIGYTDSP